MKKYSDKKCKEIEMGATVKIPVPDIDKGKGEAHNILAYAVEKSDDGFYKLATKITILFSDTDAHCRKMHH